MDILMTGNLPVVSDSFFTTIGEEYQCVVFYKDGKLNFKGKNVLMYLRNETEHELKDVFTAFGFETVVYFSYILEGNAHPFKEIERLEEVLRRCRESRVKRFLYITSNNLPQEEEKQTVEREYVVLKEACESFCHDAATQDGIDVEVLKVPYLYRKSGGEDSFVFLKEALQNGKVAFPGKMDFTTDFLCDEDLGELVGRIFDEPCPEPFIIMHVSGGNPITYGELGKLMKLRLRGLEMSFGTEYAKLPRCRKGKNIRTEYGWYPKSQLDDLLADTIRKVQKERAEQKKWKKRLERQRYREKWKEKVRIFLELIVMFGITEILNWWTRGNVMVNFIDFHLIYVVLMGTMNGLNAGILAAILSSVGYLLVTANGTPWQILFYNVQNWLPFACYILLGAITGYTRDKYDDDVRYAKEGYKIIEDKYVFLSSLYLEVLAGKEEFSHQIIGYQDSYGKMYSIVKKLDATLPEKVFFEAVSILEEILENSYVAIYTIDQQSDFARLNICSKNCNHRIEKSMRMTEYPIILETLHANGIFENKQALADYPAYATPIFRDDELVGMILLMKAETNQMNLEFSNKFRIVTNLVRDSLIRAMDSNDRKKINLEGTRILSAESFAEVLEVKRQMKQKQYLEFLLLRINAQGASLEELNEKISSVIRNNDVLGIGEDGNLYLLLSQTAKEDLQVVAERLHGKEITFEMVKE